MNADQQITDELLLARIIQAVATNLPDHQVVSTHELSGGISAKMVAVTMESATGPTTLVIRQPSAYRYRQNANAAELEFSVMQAVRNAGVICPEPLWIETGTPTEDRPFFAIEFIDGRPTARPDDPKRFILQFAAQLARIHRTDAHSPALSVLNRQEAPTLQPSRAKNEALRESEIFAALNRFGQPRSPNPPALLHGDYWPGNVLWRDGQIVAVVDWEESLIGDPLLDLAISRLDVMWILGMNYVHEFTDAYLADNPIDLSDLPFWDLQASLRPGIKVHYWPASYAALDRADINLETMIRDQNLFVESALTAIPRNH